jgi:hypothetical protein
LLRCHGPSRPGRRPLSRPSRFPTLGLRTLGSLRSGPRTLTPRGRARVTKNQALCAAK